MITPRLYQREWSDGILAEYAKGIRRTAGVMATGGGKTPSAMLIARLALQAGRPVLWLAHRRELIGQAIDKAKDVAPEYRVGKLLGTTKQYRAEIVVGSIQTASTDGTLNLLASRTWGLIVIDETHHVAAATYQKLLKRLRAFEDDGPFVLGVTATLDRSDGLKLGDTFESVASPTFGLVDLIRYPKDKGGPYLVPPRGIRVRIQDLDLDRVGRVAGDFKQAALGAALSAAMAPQKIVEAWTEHAKGRPTIAFLPTKLLSAEVAGAFTEAGYRAVHLDDSTPTKARDEALDAFREGKIDVLCNVGLFTEGTDLPMCSCVILGRITSSTTLYQQMLGRGLRMHPGKIDCVILDVTGVTSRHRVATLVNLGGADRPEDIPDDLLMYEDDEDAAQAALDEVDEADTAADAPPVEYADGNLEHELIDLFGESHSAWLRTDAGVWFLPAGPDGFLFLRPAGGGRWDVVGVAKHNGRTRPRPIVLHEHMEIGYAMAAGDAYVAAHPMWQTDRQAAWRADPGGARGTRRGGMTRGEIWDQDRRTEAARAIDPLVMGTAPNPGGE